MLNSCNPAVSIGTCTTYKQIALQDLKGEGHVKKIRFIKEYIAYGILLEVNTGRAKRGNLHVV